MTVNFELMPTPEVVVSAPQPPSFVIDEATPPQIADQLILDEVWLLKRPATRILALRQFKEDRASIQENSIWHRLTDKETAAYLEFDSATESAIAHDGEYRQLTERRAEKTSQEAAETRTLKIRLRRLEIFLERAKASRDLGRAALIE